MTPSVEIPKRAFFKSAEVCAIAGVQPYVLKSWEAEFPSLGGKQRKDGSRVYGRPEVELVLEIKALVYDDGLTLGAARRKLQEDHGGGEADLDMSLPDLAGDDAREKLAAVKQGLREILDLLSARGQGAVQEPLQLDSVTASETPEPVAEATAKRSRATRTTRARTTKTKPAAKRKRRTA